jgi:hypothetical protein
MKNTIKKLTALALLLVVSACANSNPNSEVFSQYDYASTGFESSSFYQMNNGY